MRDNIKQDRGFAHFILRVLALFGQAPNGHECLVKRREFKTYYSFDYICCLYCSFSVGYK